MSLDFTKVALQVAGMATRLRASGEDRSRRLTNALGVLHARSAEVERLKRKIAASKTTWLVAGLVDALDRCYAAPSKPADYTVIAADGSHIDVDRHRSARCYLINIGSIILHYGEEPDAVLESYPCLYSGDEDLVITSGMVGGREQPVEGALLGIKRSVEECRQLAVLAGELPPDSLTLALLDGTLILWGLEAYPEFVTEALLDKGFLRCLDDMKKLNQDRRLALASYISFTRSNEVVNSLRVALCPHEVVDSDRHCASCKTRECDSLTGIRDSELFSHLLVPGERSALFISPSRIQKRYGAHQVYFFYLKAGDEMARVEIPQWVAADEKLLTLAHSLVLDQCQRGHGYPVALSEAHEKAVVTGADREQFWQLVESALLEEHLPTPTSAKSFSKKTRWV